MHPQLPRNEIAAHSSTRISLRKDSRTLAEGRGSAVAEVRSAQYSLEPWTDSLVDIRATSDISFKAIGRRDGVLAHDCICELGTLRTDQRYSHHYIFCFWSRRFGCNLFDPGDVRALQWADPSVERSAPSRSRATRPIADNLNSFPR